MPDRPASSSDPYATLGLERGATMPEVKRAYRRLAKAYHPDSAGEAALSRFLAIHEAYESIRTGRPMPRARGATTSAPTRPAEPWRADPERARAARERARGGRARAAGGSAAPGGPGTGAGAGTSPGAGTSSGAGTRGSRDRSSSAGDPSSSGATGTSGTPRSARRHVRKATMGSTSYDEARETSDAAWGGASWYGPSTGEYWIINPREYADPRKHGPEYQSRARRPLGAADGEADPATLGGVDEPAPPPPPEEPAASSAAAGGPADATSTAQAGPLRRGARAEPPPAAMPDGFAERTPPRRAWSPAGAGPGAREREDASAPAWSRQWDIDRRRASPSPSRLGRRTVEELAGLSEDPVRRLGVALIGWPPLGLAAAAVIGDATGCSIYAADCGGAEPLLPWLAQAVILGLLLVLPAVARLVAGGSIGVLLALVPVTAFLVAVGGTGAPQAGFALSFFLALAWLAGVAWMLRHQLRPAGRRMAR